jgi:hypothetical protein
VPINREQLPDDAKVLRRMVLDLIAQLDAEQARRIKTENLLRQLLAAKSGRRSEQITDEQLALFKAELKAQGVNVEDLSKGNESGTGPDDPDPPAQGSAEPASRGRRSPLPSASQCCQLVKDDKLTASLCNRHLRFRSVTIPSPQRACEWFAEFARRLNRSNCN